MILRSLVSMKAKNQKKMQRKYQKKMKNQRKKEKQKKKKKISTFLILFLLNLIPPHLRRRIYLIILGTFSDFKKQKVINLCILAFSVSFCSHFHPFWFLALSRGMNKSVLGLHWAPLPSFKTSHSSSGLKKWSLTVSSQKIHIPLPRST